jgi:hypothetical protein
MSENIWINQIRPKPMPFDLIRIGNGKDGSYLIPDDLKDIEACFSPGVDNYKYFEDYLALNYGIKSHMCDYSSDVHRFSTVLIPGMQTFEKKWLDIGGEDSISLGDWVGKYSPNSESDLLLQMDIEGAEFRNINSIEGALLERFRIIVIEVHGFSRLLQNTPNEVHLLIQKLSLFHDVVHAAANNCCGESVDVDSGINLPNVIELTFLRRDRISIGYGFMRYPKLPHPLDINNTVNRPIFLNNSWLHCDLCTLNVDKIQRELNEWDANFYKKGFELLNNAVKNYFIAGDVKTLNSKLINSSLDLAAGKKFFTSSKQYGLVINKTPFFFHTTLNFLPSITIDLGDEFVLAGFEIANRSDVCFDRASALAYVTHLDSDFDGAEVTLIDLPEVFIKGMGKCLVIFPTSLTARYLTILSFKAEPLHFSGVKIHPPA